MRDRFQFLRSYYEMFKHLKTKKDQALFINSILSSQFLLKKVEILPEFSPSLQMALEAVSYQVNSSVAGHIDKNEALLSKGDGKGDSEDLPNKKNKNKKLEEEEEVKERKEKSLVPLTESQKVASLVADYLLHKIRTQLPNFKQPSISAWVKDIDLAIRIDKRTKDQLIGCINWIYSKDGSFWRPHVQSGRKLRAKFDTMESQMVTKTNKNDMDWTWLEELEKENAS